MASLTIHNLDESLKAALRLRSARNGCSLEEEARQILRQMLTHGTPAGSLARRIHGRFAGLDAESLPIPDRGPLPDGIMRKVNSKSLHHTYCFRSQFTDYC